MENQRQCVIPIHKPGIKELIFFFSSGILVSIPFTFFFSQIYVYFPAFISIVIFAPLIEELAKVFPLFYRHGETERSIVTLGLLIGLGFGIAEFVLYVFFLDTPFIARIPGIVFHTSSTAITAFGIAKKNFLPYYFIAVLLHLANNLFAVIDIPFSLFVVLLVIITAYYLAWRYYHQASKEKIVV
ncbi:MAG: PrsW family glutamic-type intramembrane protease [Candidatus Bathyarchaeota archaeon]|jgi:RsiW-degrading membrane proteinase PrsW (M82 family)|nr:PrsW family glutamic-type intramembrane protease [Candidatus Bathyarchaeota archaeon]